MDAIELMHRIHGRAAHDAAFRRSLVADAKTVLADAGVALPADVEAVEVVEERPGEAVFPIPSQEQLPDLLDEADLPVGPARELHRRLRDDPDFRTQMGDRPAEALAAIGVSVPEGTAVRTVPSLPNRPVVVLPPFVGPDEPGDPAELTADQLATIVAAGTSAQAACVCGSQLAACFLGTQGRNLL